MPPSQGGWVAGCDVPPQDAGGAFGILVVGIDLHGFTFAWCGGERAGHRQRPVTG
jgi:hypothetical protein